MTDSAQVRDPCNDPMLQALPTEKGYKVLDRRWVLFDILGHGGMGVVYRGKHLRMGHEVAIKCLDPVLARRDPQFVKRFEKEARAAAKVNDPNVIQVHDVAEDSGLYFMAMQYVDGENARQRVERKGPLSVQEAVTIALGAARGLAAAHHAGLVHRDVKPDNILVSTTGEVKLADLGLAKMDDGDTALTAAGSTMGTPRYMPPEQYDDAKSVGPAADVYSLGATLYFLLVGSDAIQGRSGPEVMRMVCQETFPRVTSARPDVPAAVDELIVRCVSPTPAARPTNGDQLVAALTAIEGGTGFNLEDDAAEPTLLGISLVSPPPDATLMQIQQTLMVGGNTGGIAARVSAPAPALAPAPDSAGEGGARQMRTAIDIADDQQRVRQQLQQARGQSKRRRRLWIPLAAVSLLLAAAALGHWLSPEFGEQYGVPPFSELLAQLPWVAAPSTTSAADLPLTHAAEPESGPLDSAKLPLNTSALPEPQRSNEAAATPTSPSVLIDEPPLSDGLYVSSELTLRLKGQRAPGADGPLIWEVDGLRRDLALDDQGGFDVELQLTAGARQTISLSLDGSAPTVFDVAHDDVPPQLTVLTPFGDALRTSKDRVDIQLAVDDAYLASVTIDGRLVNPDDSGRYSLSDLALLEDGPHDVVCVAEDRAGLRTVETIVVERDTRAPLERSLLPARHSTLAMGSSFELVLEFDEAPAAVLVDGLPLTIEGFSARGLLNAPDRAGAWAPLLDVSDDLGNSHGGPIDYVLERPLPTLKPDGFTILAARPPAQSAAQADGPAARAGWAWRVRDEATGMVFLRLEPGEFLMGSPASDKLATTEETPQHPVQLTHAIYMGETEITNAQYHPEQSHSDDLAKHPAVSMDWTEAVKYCDDHGYRLPSEAEWEYACRAQTSTPWNTGETLGPEQANVATQGSDTLVPTGSYAANAWGFFDMHGNVAEFCRDVYDARFYGKSSASDPLNDGKGSRAVVRGGSSSDPLQRTRSAFRNRLSKGTPSRNTGFRPVVDIEDL